MVKEARAVGRPRNFDESVVIDQAVTTFWKYGETNTTMRVLEREIGLRPASVYNAFGSKHDLLKRALQYYLEQVADQLLAPLEAPDAGLPELLRFIDEAVEWVTDDDHLGCMMLNLLGEQPQREESMMGPAKLHRDRMRAAMHPALARIDESQAKARGYLLVAGVMGISIAARGGADRGEMAAFASALKDQVGQWANG